MELLERDQALDDLRHLLRQADAGRGCLLLLGGEAGVGKTTLLRRFLIEARAQARVLAGHCEALSTPRALGPLFDLDDPELNRLLVADAPPDRLFRALLEKFKLRTRALLLAIEDVHWADAATLDLLRFLGRRIEATHGLVIATYRDDEIGPRHPLRRVIGDLATHTAVRRLAVPPLSLQAVNTLAGGEVDSVELYERTGGNPFFITEVLAAGGAIPPNVRDAVLARASRLTPGAWDLLTAAAVIGSPIDFSLLDAVVYRTAGELEECLERGMLLAEGHSLAFRHELAREAILSAIPPPRRTALHFRILRAMETAPPHHQDAARLAHHAEEAGDSNAILRHAPSAARKAASLGAHREAAAQYDRALRFASALPRRQQALLLEAHSYECYLTARIDRAIDTRLEALRIWTELDDSLRAGENRCHLAALLWAQTRVANAEREAENAVEVLERLPPGPELAMAYGTLARLRSTRLADDLAIQLGDQAIALAERVGARDTLVDALITVGEAQLAGGLFDRGEQHIELAMSLADDAELHGLHGRGYISLGYGYFENGQLATAARHFERGIRYCEERDLDLPRHHIVALLARVHCRLGNWDLASQLANSVLNARETAPGSRFEALLAASLVLTRKGDCAADPVLDEALAMAIASGCDHFLTSVRAIQAEGAFLAGDCARIGLETRTAPDLATERGRRWYDGELAYWQWKCGIQPEDLDGFSPNFARQVAGDWVAAAAGWDALEFPYEAAQARLESDDEASLRAALATFDRLGARPAANMARDHLHDLGARHVPRGPRPSTRSHPAGLTTREIEILRLIIEGKSNQEIARRLYRSTRTVENHVAAILAKLGAKNRAEARDAARLFGIFPQSE